MVTNKYTVKGMTCDHCVRAVSTEVEKLPGVTAVEIELTSGEVAVTSDGPLSLQAMSAAVDEAGYELEQNRAVGGP